ncbi:MAG: ADP-ribosylglycohydrolase family protein [Bacteroidota bacterium]|nr:ADP-ribosylglycohydrolase family protein [Bacteroidota bacterium]MDP4190879.1 ADP-ribosylglycohydrolase family protein [Bacteroidota bacterium]MDP4195283.1 ADP-ribosylglycohydrolase family protein [Bacteroidota bacterium]
MLETTEKKIAAEKAVLEKSSTEKSFDKQMIMKKAMGTLLGVAYGDSFGMPTSLWNPEKIKKEFPEGVTTLLPAPEGHIIHGGMQAGQVTDDTQQTLLLADLYIEEHKFSREGSARKLLAWAKSLNAFENSILGPSSLKALKMIEAGVPLEKTGTMGDTNGAAMKISPVGIVHPADYDAVVKDVAEVCIPTHNTDIAIAGASAIACAVACAMAGGSIAEMVEAFFLGAEKGMQHGNQWYGASVIKRTELALQIIRSSKKEKEIWQDLYDYIGAGVAMPESAATSIALVVLYNGNPLKTAYAAANMGGDCDTIGAIAGSMAGAFSGSDVFPIDIIEKLSKVNKINFEEYGSRLSEIICR